MYIAPLQDIRFYSGRLEGEIKIQETLFLNSSMPIPPRNIANRAELKHLAHSKHTI